MNTEKKNCRKRSRTGIGATRKGGFFFYFRASEREGRDTLLRERERNRDETLRARNCETRGNEERERERRWEGERRRAVEPGLAPLRSFFSLAQRLTGIFCRPNGGDVKIALMVDQREKPCSDRYLSFSRLRVSPRSRI